MLLVVKPMTSQLTHRVKLKLRLMLRIRLLTKEQASLLWRDLNRRCMVLESLVRMARYSQRLCAVIYVHEDNFFVFCDDPVARDWATLD